MDEVFLPLWCKGQLSHRLVLGKASPFIYISGLSKSTGLGYSRIGWTISDETAAEKIYRAGLLLHSDFPAPVVPVVEYAFKNWRKINQQLLQAGDANRPRLRKFAEQHPVSHDFSRGFFGMLKVPPRYASGAEFASELLRHKILVRDGAHFEMPEWFRIHILYPPRAFARAFGKIASYY